MRTTLTCTALLMAATAAWAGGPIVRWDRIEGNLQHAAGTIEVAGIPSSERGVTVKSGKAMFNVATGFLSVDVEGLAYDRHYPANDRPIGTYPGGLRMATIVCDSTRASAEIVDTPPDDVVDGDWSYRGFIFVPASCRERPELIVLLVRLAGAGPRYGDFLAYGAGRSIK